MYKGKKILGVIPARGGSKGVPKKNIKRVCGKPLIAYSIETALKSEYLDKIVVSTDSDEIARVSRMYGSEVVKRPRNLAMDKSFVIDALRYTVREIERKGFIFDAVLLLEPTSALRTALHIDSAIRKLIDNKADSVATFCQSCIYPNRIWKIQRNKVEPFIRGANPWLPRQIQPLGFQLNGLVYALTKKILMEKPSAKSLLRGKILPIITSRERSLDIDTEMDFIILEHLIKQDRKHPKDRTYK